MSAPAEHRKRSKSLAATPARAAWGRLDHIDHLVPLPPSSFRMGLACWTLGLLEESVFRRVLGDLNPPPSRRTAPRSADPSACRGWSAPARSRSRIFSQVRHSTETMRTLFGADRHAVRRHSSDVRIPSATACLTAVFTVERLTPASAAIWLMVSRHRPRRATSAAIVDRTAVSAMVNRHASCGGSHPEPVQRRRRSM